MKPMNQDRYPPHELQYDQTIDQLSLSATACNATRKCDFDPVFLHSSFSLLSSARTSHCCITSFWQLSVSDHYTTPAGRSYIFKLVVPARSIFEYPLSFFLQRIVFFILRGSQVSNRLLLQPLTKQTAWRLCASPFHIHDKHNQRVIELNILLLVSSMVRLWFVQRTFLFSLEANIDVWKSPSAVEHSFARLCFFLCVKAVMTVGSACPWRSFIVRGDLISYGWV